MRTRHTALLFALPIWLACADATEGGAASSGFPNEDACQAWRDAADRYAVCDPQALPPVGPGGIIVCQDDGVPLDTYPEAMGSTEITLSECAEFLTTLRAELGDPDGEECLLEVRRLLRNRSSADSRKPRLYACTTGVVADWSPAADDEPCEAWKRGSTAKSQCDVAIFRGYYDGPDDGVTCITDAEVAAKYPGHDSVAACAAFLFESAYPCEVLPNDSRATCSNLQFYPEE